MVGTVIFLTIIIGTLVAGKYAIKLGQEAERNKMQHNRHYNSLDENSPYSERPCKGKKCGCRSKEPKRTDFNSSGDM